MSIKMPQFKSFLMMISLAALVAFAGGCSDGDDGLPGVTGTPGADVDPTVVEDLQSKIDELEAQLHTDESCFICHDEGGIAGVPEAHPAIDPKAVVSDIVISSVAGVGDSVTFNVFEDDGTTGITGLTINDLRFYMADIVPADGTDTLTTFVDTAAPVLSFETPYLERWMYERGGTARSGLPYPNGALVDNTGGSYTYTFTVDLEVGGVNNPVVFEADAAAPDFDVTDTQRLLIRADTEDLGFSRTIGLLDFVIPADGSSSTEVGVTREIVVMAACTQCHGDPLEEAAHGGGYQSPQACNICHSPLGDNYGDLMQNDEAWLAPVIHKIHQAVDMDAFPDRIELDVNGDGEIRELDFDDDGTITAAELADPLREQFGYSKVAYPRHKSDCLVCHFDDGQDMANVWKENPTIETCTTCHDVTFSGATPTHSGGTQANNSCSFCHPADGTIGVGSWPVSAVHTVTTLKNDPLHGWETDGVVHVDEEVSNVHAYTATLTLTPPANGTHYVATEEILVTVTTSNGVAGDYNNPDGPFTRANVYVYGPRAGAVPILTPGSTTDPAFISMTTDPEDPAYDPTATADQGRDMRISAAADDAQVLTDAAGFKYQLQAIPADLAAGTYMVMAYVTHPDSTAWYRGTTATDGWAFTTIQVGTATAEPRVSGDCAGCHDQTDWSSFYHRSYFGTDGCIACHDQSGNHANPIANRVHAAHAASVTGDLVGGPWNGTRSAHSPTFPREISSCEACHTSGNESYLGDEPASWGVPCIGCHGDAAGARDHMMQNGAPLVAH